MSKVNTNALAAHQIARQFWGLALVIVMAIAQAASVRVAQAVGQQNRAKIKLATYTNISIGFCVMLFIGFFYILFPKWLVNIDISIHDPNYLQLLHNAAIFLAIASISQIIDSFRLIAVGALRGLKDTRIPMLISLFAFWVCGVPIAYTLIYF